MTSNSNSNSHSEVDEFVSFPDLTTAIDEWEYNKPKLKVISPAGITQFARDMIQLCEKISRPTLDTITNNVQWDKKELIKLIKLKDSFYTKLDNQESRMM
eukprot:200732_1